MKTIQITLLGSIFCSLASFAQAHQHVEIAIAPTIEPEGVTSSMALLSVADIQPVAEPFTHVPNYFFANPRYVRKYWKDENLTALRTAAETVSKEQIMRLVLRQNPHLDKIAFDRKAVEAAEIYDWIYTMNFITEHLHKDQINVRFVQELNRRLGRLTIGDPGTFRVQTTAWHLYQFDTAETIFWEYINRSASYREFFRNLGGEHPLPFCESTVDLMNDQDRYLRVLDARYIATQSIKDFFAILNAPENLILDQDNQPRKIDILAADSWESEEKETNPDYKAGYIDSFYWVKKRMHEFYSPEDVSVALHLALQNLSESSLHPLEKAARIWVDIVRIHPFNHANKQTARAVASRILLEHGYLPPLLTSDDLEEYLKVLLVSLDPENGYGPFTQFLARMVKRTQEQRA